MVRAIGKFRPYIEGYDFKVVTDHNSLRWLCSINPTSRLARWALELQAHRFIVEHRKGALNYVADALSRMYEEDEPAVASVTWSHTTDDPWYLEWVDKVTINPEDYPTWKLVAENLYIYRPNAEVSEVLGDDNAWKVVVPQEHRQAVLRECHHEAVAGHLGREKTFARVAQHYYWPRYYPKVGDYVRKCQVCQQYKVKQKAPAGHMGRCLVERPWQVVAGDIIGPLPRSPKGHEYVLVFQDLFTRWVEALAVKTVIEELNR